MYAATRNSILRSWGYRHPYVVTGMRIIAGTWNLILGIILIAHGYRWAWVLFVVSAVVFTAAYVLAHRAPALSSSDSGPGQPAGSVRMMA